MQQKLGQEYKGEARAQFLQDNCDLVEEIGYNRKFTPEEITDMKDHLSEVAIEINDIEIEKKEAMKTFKDQLSPLKTRKVALLKNIKLKSEWMKEPCYKFISQDERLVSYYNSEGELVEFRSMRPEESQLTLRMVKTGTDN